MVHFWPNWKSSEGGFTMCPTLPNKILQNLSRKIPSKKNVPLHRRYNALQRGSNCHFCQKNAFFGQKMTFFQNHCFIEKWSVTQNTTFKCIKNIFLLSNQELVFFTEFNLMMTYLHQLQEHMNLHFYTPKVLATSSCSWAWSCRLCRPWQTAWSRRPLRRHTPPGPRGCRRPPPWPGGGGWSGPGPCKLCGSGPNMIWGF